MNGNDKEQIGNEMIRYGKGTVLNGKDVYDAINRNH